MKKQMKLKDLPRDHPAQNLRSDVNREDNAKAVDVPWTDYDPKEGKGRGLGGTPYESLWRGKESG